MMFYLPNS